MEKNINEILNNKKIMVIISHTDDLEDYIGGTLLKLLSDKIINPCNIFLLVATNGDKGGRDKYLDGIKLSAMRKIEQENSFNSLSIPLKNIVYLDLPDGDLDKNKDILLESVVKYIRLLKPEIIMTHTFHNKVCIAENGEHYIVHPDHIALGNTVLDAIYPKIRDLLYYPQHLELGLSGHIVSELILFESDTPNVFVDITNHIDAKVELLMNFKTQIESKDELLAYYSKLYDNSKIYEKLEYIKILN